MENNTRIGLNRTGIQMSPLDSERLKDIVNSIPIATIAANEHTLETLRPIYVKEAESIGSVPFPGSFAGAANSIMEKLSGQNLEILIDKLGERAAFERTGTRLYDALIAKCIGLNNKVEEKLSILEQFREQEIKHFKMVVRAIESLGADPSAQTPCADMVSVSSLGIIQVITDPRSNWAQSLNALLTAELTDNAGWELLIELAQRFDRTDMAVEFEGALQEEGIHLKTINTWLKENIFKQTS